MVYIIDFNYFEDYYVECVDGIVVQYIFKVFGIKVDLCIVFDCKYF